MISYKKYWRIVLPLFPLNYTLSRLIYFPVEGKSTDTCLKFFVKRQKWVEAGGKSGRSFLALRSPLKTNKQTTTCKHCYFEKQLRAKMLRWAATGWYSDLIPVTLPSERCHFLNDLISKSGSLMLLRVNSAS